MGTRWLDLPATLDRVLVQGGRVFTMVRSIERTLNEVKGLVMAVGPQTQAALDELGQAIADEVAERLDEALDAEGVDADTAQAIRDKVVGVKGIVVAKVVESGDDNPPAGDGTDPVVDAPATGDVPTTPAPPTADPVEVDADGNPVE